MFVHRTAPGDVVDVELTESRERWARGRLLRLVEESTQRREPPCPLYGECGGCTLEHVQYGYQLDAKARIVSDALTRIGRLPVEPPVVESSPEQFRYRNRVSFTLRRIGAGRVVAGFHALAEPDRVVDVDGRCLLPEEPIARVWDRMRASWGSDASRLPSGEQLRLTLRSTAAERVSLLVEGGFSPGRPEEILERVEGLDSIWHRPGAGPAQLLAGAPGLPESWGDETVDVSGTAFLQVNRMAARVLEDHVLEVIGDVEGLRVVDAYCGVGFHARRLARAGARVVGLELDPAAVEAAVSAAPEGAEFRQGAVEDLIAGALPADLVILNPPRGGVAEEVAAALVAAPPKRIVYVSCNPATLARDIGRLTERFQLDRVRSFDLFPQTAHVETVAELNLRP